MAGLVLRKCPCLRPKIEEEVRVLDYRHSSLTDVPGDVFNFERTLEELYTDSNQIRDLPRVGGVFSFFFFSEHIHMCIQACTHTTLSLFLSF